MGSAERIEFRSVPTSTYHNGDLEREVAQLRREWHERWEESFQRIGWLVVGSVLLTASLIMGLVLTLDWVDQVRSISGQILLFTADVMVGIIGLVAILYAARKYPSIPEALYQEGQLTREDLRQIRCLS